MAGEFERQVHQAIRAITRDIENVSLNTAISHFMTLINVAHKEEHVGHDFMSIVARMLQPFAPHLAEELWQRLGKTGFVFAAPWPEYDPALCEARSAEVVIQVGGKRRGSVRVPVDSSAADVEAAARQQVKNLPAPDEVRKTHYVSMRVLNLVV